MRLQENPFYLLNITCRDDRRKIVTAAEEMNFELEPEVCTDAQNSLLNMSKRLSCELNWFPAEDKQTIESIRERIRSGTAITIRSSDPVSQLNAVRFNYSLLPEPDIDALSEHILAINNQYAILDDAAITARLNECRAAAKMAEVSGEDVSVEINSLRSDIRQEISAGLAGLDDTAYRDMITKLAEKMTGPEDIILSDMIDEYEIRLQSLLEEKTDQIRKSIDQIKNPSRKINRYTASMELMETVKDWDNWAQPLQMKARINGMPHRMSESLGVDLRNFAIFLHNERKELLTSFIMTAQLKEIFAESPSLSQQFKEDFSMLGEKIRSGSVSDGNDSFLQELNDTAHALCFNRKNEKDFYEKIREQTAALQPFKEMIGNDSYVLLRDAVFNTVRGTALKLFNHHDQPEMAKNIISWLKQEYADEPSAAKRLEEDQAKLLQIETEDSQPQPGFFKRIFTSPYS